MSNSLQSQDIAITLAEFGKEQKNLVAETISRRMKSSAEFEHLGSKAEDIMVAGFNFLNRMLETAMQLDDAGAMDHQIEWSKNRLPHDGVPVPMLLENVKMYRQVIEEKLTSSTSREILPYLDRMIARLEVPDGDTSSPE